MDVKKIVTEEIWNEEVNKFKEVRNKLGRHIKKTELSSFGLKYRNWFIDYSPKELKINSYPDFIDYCGFDTKEIRVHFDWYDEVEKYKKIRNEIGKHIKKTELTSYGLKSDDWYIRNSPKELNISKYNQFVMWCGYDICKPKRNSNNVLADMLVKIKQYFPMKMTCGDTLYLNNIEYFYISKEKTRKYMLDLTDNNGYKYYLDIHNVNTANREGYGLNKFFKRNPYTRDNINNYCMLNDIDLTLNIDIPCSGGARTNYDFVNGNGDNVNISWNNIQHYPFRYKADHKEILKKNKEERAISKQEAINSIMKMQELKDTPIDSSDFRIKQDGFIGIKTIIKYWGTIKNMQEELGLPHTGCYKTKLTKEEYIQELKSICDIVYKTENRKTILKSDFDKYGSCEVATYRRYCEDNNTTLQDTIFEWGFSLQKSGNGMNYCFDDGEKTASKYEFDFSNFLRAFGLKYNIDYFRNIYYKKIDDEYAGNMNCDYVIKTPQGDVFIEIAGVLGNVEHQKAFLNNIPLQSKSKEKYRLGLNQKEDILKRNGYAYYIFLKRDMENEVYKDIICNLLNIKKVG